MKFFAALMKTKVGHWCRVTTEAGSDLAFLGPYPKRAGARRAGNTWLKHKQTEDPEATLTWKE